MALTDKGRRALELVSKYYPKGHFSANDLSTISGETVAPASLTAVAKNGYLNKFATSPVTYEAIDNLLMLIETELKKDDGCDNSNLRSAKKVKNDEFYTHFSDIEKEVGQYRKQLKGKSILLNCNDTSTETNGFLTYFITNFDFFGLREVVAMNYNEDGSPSYYYRIADDLNDDGYIDEKDIERIELTGNGAFNSEEGIELLKKCDIVITNPPFSVFREFIALILEYKKQFLVIGNQNAFTYKEIFPLIRDNYLWTGYNMVKEFDEPDGNIRKFGNVCWFTNLITKKRTESMILTEKYNVTKYPKYDNYDAIEVGRLVDIPKDYDGLMGVPITFLDKYNPNQFTIIGGFNGYKECDYDNGLLCGTVTDYIDSTGKIKQWTGPTVNKQAKYYRILIKKK